MRCCCLVPWLSLPKHFRDWYSWDGMWHFLCRKQGNPCSGKFEEQTTTLCTRMFYSLPIHYRVFHYKLLTLFPLRNKRGTANAVPTKDEKGDPQGFFEDDNVSLDDLVRPGRDGCCAVEVFFHFACVLQI